MITNPVLNKTIQDKSGVDFFQTLLPNLLSMGFIIGVLIFLAILIMGAIQWISSGGDKGTLEAAKSKVTNAIIGIVVLFSVFAVLKVLEGFFGITILTIDIGKLAI